MDFIRIAKTADFEGVSMRSYRILGRHVGVFREADGAFRAMEVGCRHQNADLTQAGLRGNVATCPRHGWQYNLATGECLKGDGQALRPYHCRVEGGNILISALPVRAGETAETGSPKTPAE